MRFLWGRWSCRESFTWGMEYIYKVYRLVWALAGDWWVILDSCLKTNFLHIYQSPVHQKERLIKSHFPPPYVSLWINLELCDTSKPLKRTLRPQSAEKSNWIIIASTTVSYYTIHYTQGLSHFRPKHRIPRPRTSSVSYISMQSKNKNLSPLISTIPSNENLRRLLSQGFHLFPMPIQLIVRLRPRLLAKHSHSHPSSQISQLHITCNHHYKSKLNY